MQKGVVKRRRTVMSTTEGAEETTEQQRRSSSPRQDHGEAEPEVSLLRILNELQDFRRDNKQQLADIKQELSRTNTRLEEAEERIGHAETRLQAAATLIQRLLRRQTDMEAKLADQEGRSHRDNLRIYGIPEEAEGKDMIGFLENLLKRALDFPHGEQLRIERAHRALVPKPPGSQGRPRSIVAQFSSHRTKEEVLRKAWQKKEVFCNNVRFYVDHDYPPAVLKKRSEYSEAKKVLKEKKIKFQTPYPARLRVFY
uniref:L1 transposable element RRM domain-containing protein n=1 Tax=Pygocentrus nattereri TaxID=42514 RepID=A0AAR2LCR7_PYGNA